MTDSHDETTETPALLKAHSAVVIRRGKAEADAVLIKYGAPHGGPGAYRQVPEARRAACQAELERIAAGPASDDESTQRAMQKMQRSAFANIGTTETKKPRTPRSLAELQREAMARFNHPPRGE